MKTLPISVLIPTMNRPETLKATLNSYLKGEYIPSQIVVVDQSQEIETANTIKALVEGLPQEINGVYLFQAQPSLTKARNFAKEYAKEEIIICSDDDIDVYEDTLKNIFDVMSNKEISMIAGIDDNTSKASTNIGYLLGTKSFKNRKIGHVTASMLGRYPDNVQGEVETQWAMGYFFVVRKSLLEKWDIRWDENLTSYAYAEDLDFSYSYYKQSLKENLRCILSDRVRVKHLASKEYRIPSKKSTYMYVINRAYLSYKHQMGIKSTVAMGWCNFWRWVERVVKKENPRDMWQALRLAKKEKQLIKKGEIKKLY